MENHKEVKRYFTLYDEKLAQQQEVNEWGQTYTCGFPEKVTLQQFIDQLLETAKGLKDPIIKDVEYLECYIVGWEPLSEKELEAKRQKEIKAREKMLAKLAKDEQAERELYESLRTKYESVS